MSSKKYFYIGIVLMVMSLALFIVTIVVNAKEPESLVIYQEVEKIIEPVNHGRDVGAAEVLNQVNELSYITKEKTTYLGEFTLTAYCSCSKCCGKWADKRPVDEDGNEIVVGATGERLFPDYSIAVDPKIIPYGTVVEINGHEYKAQDCGGGIKGNRIDVYFSDHQEALKFGKQKADVYIKEVTCEVE